MPREQVFQGSYQAGSWHTSSPVPPVSQLALGSLPSTKMMTPRTQLSLGPSMLGLWQRYQLLLISTGERAYTEENIEEHFNFPLSSCHCQKITCKLEKKTIQTYSERKVKVDHFNFPSSSCQFVERSLTHIVPSPQPSSPPAPTTLLQVPDFLR